MSIQSNFGYNKYEIQVKDARSFNATSDDGLITSGCLVFVYDAGTKTLSTLYADGSGTTLANPITRAQFASDDMIKFWSASTSHDVVVNDDKGNTGDYPGVTPSTHSVPLDRTGAAKCLIVPFGVSDNTETDTGLDLPYKAHVHDVAVEVTEGDSGETISIGLLSSETAGDADGLIAALSVASTGFVKPFVVTEGSSETYVSSAVFGALMGPVTAGADDANADTGVARGWGHVVDGSNAKSITYTGSSGSDTAAGYIYVKYTQLR